MPLFPRQRCLAPPRARCTTAGRCHDGACGLWRTGGAAGCAETAQAASARRRAPGTPGLGQSHHPPTEAHATGAERRGTAHHARTFRHRTSPRGRRDDVEPHCAHCFRTGERRAGQELHSENERREIWDLGRGGGPGGGGQWYPVRKDRVGKSESPGQNDILKVLAQTTNAAHGRT